MLFLLFDAKLLVDILGHLMSHAAHSPQTGVSEGLRFTLPTTDSSVHCALVAQSFLIILDLMPRTVERLALRY